METFNKRLQKEARELYRELSTEDCPSVEQIDYILTLRVEQSFENLTSDQYNEIMSQARQIQEKLISLNLNGSSSKFNIGQRVKWTSGNGKILSKGVFSESLEDGYSVVRMIESGGQLANAPQKVLTDLLVIDED